MLLELRIQNFAIIDKLELELGAGLSIFTGETGAGKSIIIDAVETLLGVRADTSFIRTGIEIASVEGTFSIPEGLKSQIHAILNEEDLLDEANFVTLQREFRREGRNTARVNGRVVSLALLKRLGEHLIDLHGQSEHLSLLRVPSHLGLLDRFAEVEPEQGSYQATYKRLMSTRKELATLLKSETDAERRAELLKFQIDEIKASALIQGEEEELKSERVRLANAEALAQKTNQALTALDATDPEYRPATDLLGEALAALESLVAVDATKSDLRDMAQSAFDQTADLARELGNYLEEIEFNPTRLEEVEERLDLIRSLKRKYGDSIEQILEFAGRAEVELDSISHAEERLQVLQKEEAALLQDLSLQAQRLSSKRKTAAEDLSRKIELELADLKMEKARFGVDFQVREDARGIKDENANTLAFDVHGYDLIEFLVEPNPGEGLKPLVKIASGGETARLMLALKNVLTQADATPTLIFDEIDQGIGGRVGAVVGQKLWQLGRQHQVLCITHLAQLAGYGDAHFKVSKLVEEGRTTTVVNEVKENDRMIELAQMLGDVSEGTLQSANEILQSVKQAVSQV